LVLLALACGLLTAPLLTERTRADDRRAR